MKIIEILTWTFPASAMDSFIVDYRIINIDPDYIEGPKTKTYSGWDMAKDFYTTIDEVQEDLENDEF